MSDRRLLWIRVISGICILVGLIYLIASIMGIVMSVATPISKEFSGILWAAEALLIIYTMCFIIGGIGLALLRKWGRDILVTILWIDILLKTMTVLTPIIFNLINPHRIHPPTSPFGAFQIVLFGTLLLEIVMLFYLSRKKTKQILVPKIPNSKATENAPVEE